MKLKTRNLLLITSLASAGLLSACGGGSGGSSADATQMGTVRFSMTDAPACGFNAVNVTVVKVRVHKSSTAGETDAGWTDVTLSPSRKIDLLTLTNGVLTELGQAPLEAGTYTQTRLVLAGNTSASPLANSVVPTGGTEIALDTPSAVQSGIKLNHEFDVAAGTLADFTLDFDACKSVVTRGNGSYGLKPVVSVIPAVVSGGISGFVTPVAAIARPLVTAQLNGVVIKTTVPDATGAFTLSPMVQSATGAGYTVVVTADGYATDVVSAVPVVAKTTTVVSTAAAPLPLSTSATYAISGRVLPVSAQGAVRAIQSYAGTTPLNVTIKYQAADLVSGAYGMSLPTAPAMVGTFGNGTLPIILAAQPVSSAGIYMAEASAPTLTSRTAAVTSTTPLPLDFTLN